MADEIKIVITGEDRGASAALRGLNDSLGEVGRTALGFLAAQVFARLASGIKDIALKSIMTTARVDEMNAVLAVLAQNSGISSTSVMGQVQAIKELGITTQVAQTVTAQFIRYQLNMSQSTDLARVAQDAAVISMQNSSEALDGLIHGITTFNPRVLRTYGIVVDSAQAFEAYAASVGKAAAELSPAEKQQAMLNAVIEAGSQITGAYEAAMTTAGKQVRSFSRYTEELYEEIGGPLQLAFSDSIQSAAEFVKGLTASAQEGGKLNETLIKVGEEMRVFVSLTFDTVGAMTDFALTFPGVIQGFLGLAIALPILKNVSILLLGVVGNFSALATGIATAVRVYGSMTSMIPITNALTVAFGAQAVAIGAVAIALAALIAVGYTYYKEIVIRQREGIEANTNAWTAMYAEIVEGGGNATAASDKYVAAIKRMNVAYQSSNIIARQFVDIKGMELEGFRQLLPVLASSATSYSDYKSAIDAAAKAAGYMINAQGDLIQVIHTSRGAASLLVEANVRLTEAEYQSFLALTSVNNALDDYGTRARIAAEAAKDFAPQIEALTEDFKLLGEQYSAITSLGQTFTTQMSDMDAALLGVTNAEKALFDYRAAHPTDTKGIEKLTGKLGEAKDAVIELQKEHDKQTARWMLNILQQQLGIDGIDSADMAFLLQYQVNTGLMSDEARVRAQEQWDAAMKMAEGYDAAQAAAAGITAVLGTIPANVTSTVDIITNQYIHWFNIEHGIVPPTGGKGGGGAGGGKRQYGGRIAPHSYLWNESPLTRPEVYVGGGGYVLTKQDAMAALGGMSGGGGGIVSPGINDSKRLEILFGSIQELMRNLPSQLARNVRDSMLQGNIR